MQHTTLDAPALTSLEHDLITLEDEIACANATLTSYNLTSLSAIADAVFHEQITPNITPCDIPAIDTALGGGLTPGLTILGAASSVGKTTLTLQIADNIAERGHPVLFVSGEQTISELCAKSFKRLTAQEVAKSPLARLNPQIRANLASEAKSAAWERYKTRILPHLYIYEPDKRPSVRIIHDIACALKTLRDTSPVIIVDYLQLLAPFAPDASEKRAVDENVCALRRLSRELDTPVIAISSLNRASYSAPISYASFKESGGIEYTSDCLLGLESAPAGDTSDEYSDIHRVRLCVLKQRNRKKSPPVYLSFDAANATFEASENRGDKKVRTVKKL